nr:A24 family peptidase [Pseudonocardia sp. C8]
MAAVDLRTGKLPNWLTLLAHVLTLAGLLVATLVHLRASGLLAALVGSIVFAALYGAWYVFLPGHMGGGDLKLSAVSGAVLGWQGWPTASHPHLLTAGVQLLAWLAGALLLIWLLQAAAYLVARAVRRRLATLALRHGPFLVLGTVTALVLAP